MKFLNKLEKKFGKYAIRNLMIFIIGCYVIGYVIQFASPDTMLLLTLEPYRIFQYGEIWRIVSWILIPPQTNFFFAIIMCVFYYQLGTTLERTWGAFRFNVYIFGGIIFTILGAIVLYFATGQTQIAMGGYFTTYYINLSIFLAFALSYPDMKVLLYFIIPIKMKWMAIVYIVLAAYSALMSNAAGRVAILMSLLNFLIFFLATRGHKNVYNHQQQKTKHEFHRQMHQAKHEQQAGGQYAHGARHKCAICGRTELDDPNLEFRYCSKCNGNFEYCQDHLFTHQHK